MPRLLPRPLSLIGLGLLFAATGLAAADPATGPMPAKLAAADYHLFIIAGQSNGWGWLGDHNEGLDEPVPVPEPGTVFYYDQAKDAIGDASTLKDSAGGEYNGAVAGFVHRFAIDYAKATGKKVIIIQKSPGNSGIVPGVAYGGGNWPDTYRGELKAKYAAFRACAARRPEIAGKYAFAGMYWAQGEAEVFLLENRTKTLPELERNLSSLFDAFVADYGADYAGRPGEMIRVVLVSVFAFGSMKNDRFYPDTVCWSASRDMQRHVAEAHPQARMVFFPIELFYHQGVWGPNNAVHYKQSQYNLIGKTIAAEAVQPFSTIHPPAAPVGLGAHTTSVWRIDLTWKAPAGGVPGQLPCYRVYRRKAGESDAAWTWLWQSEAVPAAIFHDESGIEPGAAYEYRVSSRNEFGEVFSGVVTATAGTLAKDPLAAYLAAAAPAEPAKVRALWKELGDGGHLRGLRSLHLMTPGLNAAKGRILNLVRQSDQADPYDLDANDAVLREAGGCTFTGTAAATTQALIPTIGGSTFLFGLEIVTPPTGELMLFSQGAGYPYVDIDGIEQRDHRTIFSYDRVNQQVQCYKETIQGFCSGARSVVPGKPGIHALSYAGTSLRWNSGSAPAVPYDDDLYFHDIGNTPFQIMVRQQDGAVAFRIPVLAVWNRGLSETEYQAVRAILARHLGLGDG